MADAAEDVAGLPVGSVRCKWPNDLVIEVAGPNALLTGVVDAADAVARLAAPLELRKLAGVLGESDGLGTDDPRVVVGIGINADWAAVDFPPELAPTMTSLREASGGRPIDRDALLDGVPGPAGRPARGAPGRVLRPRRRGPRASASPGRLVTLEGTGRRPRCPPAGNPSGGRPSWPWGSMPRPVAWWSRMPRRRPASASSTRARSSACASRRARCNAVARAVFGRREQAATGSVVVLDRDRSLVEAARRDPAQFDALYRKYLAQVYAFALYELADHHAAEDATERTFLRALAALPRFREQARPEDGPEASTFRVWLFRIARNVVANERRTRRRRPAASLDLALGAGLAIADGTDLEADAVTRDEAAEALRALRTLPDDRRRALVLRFVDEMSTAEIAGILGRSEGAVRVLIHRALGSVARELGRDRGLRHGRGTGSRA